MKIEDLKNQKILVLGLGREGLSTFKFLRRHYPKMEIGLADQKNMEELGSDIREMIAEDNFYKLHLGEKYLDALKDYNLIVKSPGINPRLYGIEQALERGAVMTSNTRLFFQNCKGKVIGVTGTKGKSTTSSLIYEMLRRRNLKVSLIGNIGYSALDFLENDRKDKYYVFEMSSYQLENFSFYPEIGVFLNFFPDHLDYHKNEENYFEAKCNLFKRMPAESVLFYNGSSKRIREFAEKVIAKKIDFLDAEESQLVRQLHNKRVKKVKLGNEMVIDKEKVKLLGAHNLENIVCATRVAQYLDVENEIITEVIENFSGLKHRLELVGEYNGIKFYDDAISTTPESTIAAIDTFDGNLSTLILGGLNRGYDFKHLAKKIVEKKVQNLILFPDSGQAIWEEVKGLLKPRFAFVPGYHPRHFVVEDMKSCVEKAYKVTKKGKVCLLSSASPSYNLFKNFEDKADQYIHWINVLA